MLKHAPRVAFDKCLPVDWLQGEIRKIMRLVQYVKPQDAE
jgi:hypothetical protein